MTKQEVQQEFILRLLEAVELCDREVQAAYKKRQQALKELNKWFVKAWKEVSDGD